MAYSETLNLVVGDTLPALNLTLKDKNSAASGSVLDPDNSATWAPIDITGATVRLRLRELGTTAITDTRVFSVTNGTACPGAEYAEHTFRWDDEAQAGMGKRARDSQKRL